MYQSLVWRKIQKLMLRFVCHLSLSLSLSVCVCVCVCACLSFTKIHAHTHTQTHTNVSIRINEIYLYSHFYYDLTVIKYSRTSVLSAFPGHLYPDHICKMSTQKVVSTLIQFCLYTSVQLCLCCIWCVSDPVSPESTSHLSDAYGIRPAIRHGIYLSYIISSY